MRTTELSEVNGEKALCCPECGKRIKAVWRVDRVEGIKFSVRPQSDDESKYRQWLEHNEPGDN